MSKAVMTIHGFLTETKDFGRLYDYLDMYDEVKAVEIPGHNGEKPNFKLFTAEDTFKAVLSVYDELREKHDAVDVVGFSMGGALATWLCSVREVNRAALVSPANKYINATMPLSAGKFVSELGLKAFRETEGKLSDKMAATSKALSPYIENLQTANTIAKQRTFRYMNPHTYSTFSKIIKKCNAVLETTSPHQTPVLVLWGKLDELVPSRTVKFLTKHFPEAKVKIYPDVGHAMLYTNRDDEIIHDIIDFLTEGEVDVTVPKHSRK